MYQSSGEASRCAAGSEYHNTRDDGSRDGELGDAGRGGVWGVSGETADLCAKLKGKQCPVSDLKKGRRDEDAAVKPKSLYCRRQNTVIVKYPIRQRFFLGLEADKKILAFS